jgi:hypothetical protein
LRLGSGGQVYQFAVLLLDLAVGLGLNQHGKRMAHQGEWGGCDLDGLAASFDKLRQELIAEVGWIANAGYLRGHPGVSYRTLAGDKTGWIALDCPPESLPDFAHDYHSSPATHFRS